MPDIQTTFNIPEALSGQRLDVVLAELMPDYSRSRLKQWLLEGQILLDGRLVPPKTKVYSEQQLVLNVKSADVEDEDVAEDIPLDIVYEDGSLLIINKPAGLVVHPAAGNRRGTLQNALLFYDRNLAEVPRAGIVHRLDKDTSGLMVVARTLIAHKYLVEQIQQREVHREYQTLVHGVMTGGGTVDEPIGRHPRDRIRMTVREDGRPSVTHYRVLERYRQHTHLHVKLETGRTHQIRVHMQHLRHPVVGDPVYAGRSRLPPGAESGFMEVLKNFNRQALHAWRLGLHHPESGELMQWEAPLPEDMQQLVTAMKEDLAQHDG